MKNLLIFIFLSLVLASALFAQSPSAAADTYQLGDRKVRIPAPDGFAEITSQFTKVAARSRATEDPGNEMIAMHVPDTFIAKLKISEEIDLGFYTKVSIYKQAKAVDLTPDVYSGVVAEIEKQFGSFIDPNGPIMKSVEKNSGKGLTELLGKETTVNISGSTNLGFFEKSEKVFSGMALVNLEVYGRKVSVLGTLSILNVNRRLVFVYAYKTDPGADDVRTLRDFTKNWTANITAANK